MEYRIPRNNKAIFAAVPLKSWKQRLSPPATALRWHLRLGHPGPDALRHLVNAAVGVRMINLQGTRRKRNRRKKRSSSRRAVPAPAAAYSAVQTAGSEEAPGGDCVGPNQDCPAELTEVQKAALDAEKQHVPPSKTHCDACAMAKATRSEYRKPRDLSAYKPGERIAIDFHDFERDADGFKSMTLITCRVSGYMWDYCNVTRMSDDILFAITTSPGSSNDNITLTSKSSSATTKCTLMKSAHGVMHRASSKNPRRTTPSSKTEAPSARGVW
ncbi:hypothetical protein N657DRAFT_404519 [Parathielavia appendiculata]|uniref:GAG-pre-integrase domain-containing protein n=1 Tax=Parathielavia appendiculata TaxID=2587402 RepID=A0AAN6TPD8_9PEZI|nr:hypothetical protein N657DRAFT_404519 [Parathielavia appendiculata]